MRSWIISINHLRKEIKLWIFERKWQIGFWCKGGHEHIGRKWTARFRIHFTLFLAPFPFGRFAEMIDDNKHSNSRTRVVSGCGMCTNILGEELHEGWRDLISNPTWSDFYLLCLQQLQQRSFIKRSPFSF